MFNFLISSLVFPLITSLRKVHLWSNILKRNII
ncbi:unnamed protein product [Phytomonas sp. Hart1]|nr:unnamed protein product [Phytomonas sp. Hart1]|eukprot:CCW70351.1 unnamed protein product [Phytomonas sp. isolate Hart1]